MRKMTEAKTRANPAPIFLLTALCLIAMTLSACNTTAGLGRDIESAGGALEESAEDATE